MRWDLFVIRKADKMAGDIDLCPEARQSPTIKSFLEQRRFLLKHIDQLERQLDRANRIEFPDNTGK